MARREEMEAEGMTADYFPESQLSSVINWPKVMYHFMRSLWSVLIFEYPYYETNSKRFL